MFALKSTSDGSSRLNDNILLLVFSLPYLYDFSVGVVTIVLMSRIANFNGTIKVIRDNDSKETERLIKLEMEKINKKYDYGFLQTEFENRMKYSNEKSSQGFVKLF